LLTGRESGRQDAYADLHAVADQAEKGVGEFVRSKGKAPLAVETVRLERLKAAVADLAATTK
jgi:hypothetical protein